MESFDSTGTGLLVGGMLLTMILIGVVVTWMTRATFPPILAIPSRTDSYLDTLVEFRSWKETSLFSKETPMKIEALRVGPYDCIREAKRRNYSWFLMVQHDCRVAPDSFPRFSALLPYLWQRRSDWDIFTGSNSYLVHHDVVDKERRLFRVSGATPQFCLLHRDAYDRVLAVEGTAMPSMFSGGGLRIWTVTPFLSSLRPYTEEEPDGERITVNHTKWFTSVEDTLTRSLDFFFFLGLKK